jgi:glycosyltransferase involved in cell wall biosynthesis/Flp pilus assembly protein TadD
MTDSATNINKLLATADAAFAEQRFADAKAALQEALRVSPKSPEILNALGSVLFRLGEFRESCAVFGRLAEMTPTDAATWVQLAMAHEKLGAPDQFEAALVRALELDPKHRTALQLFADHLVQKDQLTEASKAYLNLLNSSPDDIRTLLALGACFYRMADTACARMIYERVLQIQPANDVAKEGLEIIRQGLRPKAELLRKPAPLISAIVTIDQTQHSLRGCFEDLARQTIADRLEIILIIRSSLQNFQGEVEVFRARFSNIFSICVSEDETVYGAWNRALRIAKGRYVTVAGAADRHQAEAFEKLSYALSQHPDIGVAYADTEVCHSRNADGQSLPVIGRIQWPDFRRGLLFQVCCVGPQPMWRKSLHGEFGEFDPALAACGAYEFWLRISGKIRFLHLPEVLGICVQQFDSIALSRESELVRRRHWPDGEPPQAMEQSCFLERYPVPRPSVVTSAETRRPAVSVMVPTFNRPAMLCEAIQSVLQQTFQDFELLIVNDAGEDVAPLLARLNQKNQIRYFRHEFHRGPSAARNTAINNARGKYIAYLDDDDLYLPDHLQTLVDHLEEHDVKVAYTDGYQAQQLVQGSQYVVTGREIAYSQNFDRDLILVGNFVPILCVMHERTCLAETGGFDESLPAVEDWDLWIRFAQHFRPDHIKKPTCEFRTRREDGERLTRSLENLLAGTDAIYRKYQHLVAEKPLLRAWQLKNRDNALRKLHDAGG